MAPIPIYTKSPINAAKADGVTPQTAAPSEKPQQETPTTTTAQQGGYPAAQPGAVPTLPAVTQTHYVPVQATPTSSLNSQGPPPPQPGAAPIAPGATAPPTAYGPPPPTITAPARLPGESPAQAPVPYPGQMAIPAPTMPYAQRGTSTASGEMRQETVLTHQLGHPPGYQQNVNATEMTSSQREAHHSAAADQYGGRYPMYGGEGDPEGVMGMARKWAQAAGDKASAIENEVWKRINGKE
jgi:hypothetical protein